MDEELVRLARDQLVRHQRSRFWWMGSKCRICGERWPCRVWRNANATIALAEGQVQWPELDTISFQHHPNARWPTS